MAGGDNTMASVLSRLALPRGDGGDDSCSMLVSCMGEGALSTSDDGVVIISLFNSEPGSFDYKSNKLKRGT
jgi:hypothetical protein